MIKMNKLLLLALFLVVLYFFLQNQSSPVTQLTQTTVQTAGSIANGINLKELVETSILLKQFQ
jgi:sensor histidine kinase regulating citrate/malate metabolism